MRWKLKGFALLLIYVLMITGNITGLIAQADIVHAETAGKTIGESDIPESLLKQDNYDQFLKENVDVFRGTADVEFQLDVSLGKGFHEVSDYTEGIKGGYYTDSDSSTVWSADIEEAGLYAIKFWYAAETDRGAVITRDLLINGKEQHSGSKGLQYTRIYQDNAEEIGKVDKAGNEIRPTQIEIRKVQTGFAKNPQGLYKDPYLYYFEKGKNTIELIGVSEPMTIEKLCVGPLPKLPSYQEYKEVMPKAELAEQQLVMIEAEQTSYKSTPVLYGRFDRSSPRTSPYDEKSQRLNMIGGTNWSTPGQYAVWNIAVPETGYYNIYLKARQNVNRDFKTNRTIYIDGQVLFQELEAWEFKFASKWQMIELGDGKNAYQFYLEKGTHELKIEACLGNITEQTKKVQDILGELNSLYTDIMVITGSTPDKMRDYRIGTLLPNISSDMLRLADELQEVIDWFNEYGSGKGKDSASLGISVKQLRKMGKDADIIPKELTFFKSNNGALANWLLKSREQPLELDYFMLVSRENASLPKANAGVIEQFGFSVASFLKSFSTDYQSLSGNLGEDGKSIRVWIPSGRDQAQVLRKLIDQSFTPETGISVNLQLVTAASLLPATVAGNGPDVALSMGDTEPVNYAIRDAVIDLNRFPDFLEVEKRFLPERMVPLRLNGKVYALPETQNFNVMFYRTDILESLSLEIPKTWTDVVAMNSILLKQNMSFALPVSVPKADLIETGTSSYFTMLFQNGGQVYKNDGASSDLDSEIGLKSFKQWTNLFVNYAFPKEYDFLSRFRTGESPAIVGNFANFNTLMVSAPEIKGLWSFALVPGTQKDNGTIDHSTPLSGVDCFIMKDSRDYDSSWEFLKWWTSAKTQVDYGKEMESVLGESARYATANVEGFSQMAWDKEFYEVLVEQMKWGRGIEQVPGGYFTGRHINNAFRRVVISKEDIRETLLDYVYIINQELIGKRKEFGLPVSEQEERRVTRAIH